jgi:MGT family glycosyltransferase
MIPRKKILFTPVSTVLAHTGRCLVLAKELQARGHHVILAGMPKYLRNPDIMHNHHFDYYEITDFDLNQGLDILRTVRKTLSRSTVEKQVEAELTMLERLQPDLVITDFRLTVYISAPVMKIPVVSLLSGQWMQQYVAKRFKALRTLPPYPFVKRAVGREGANLILPPFQRLVIRYKMRPFRQALRKYRLEKKKTLWDLLVGDFNLILDTALWSPMQTLPNNFRQIGPIVWAPESPVPQWLNTLDKKRPLIYLTMGSTGHEGLFQKLIAMLAQTDCQLIVSTAGQVTFRKENLPHNAYITAFLPGEKVMEHADIVIYHGGNGTAYQAIKAGTPCIVIATHLDQEFQGEATEEHGVGIFLTMREVMTNPALVTEAVKKILGDLPTYRQNMHKLQADLLRYNGVKEAADSIEEFINQLKK